jgi:hypothetical protein
MLMNEITWMLEAVGQPTQPTLDTTTNDIASFRTIVPSSSSKVDSVFSEYFLNESTELVSQG